MKRTSAMVALLLVAAAAGCDNDDSGPVLDDYKLDPLGYMKAHGEVIPMDSSGADRKEKAASFFLKNAGTCCSASSTGVTSADYLCLPLTIYGNFSGYNPPAEIFVYTANNVWQVLKEGPSGGQAVCTRWSNFVGPPGSVIWLMSPWETRQMVTDDHKTAPLWFGDASSHIMQVEGEFEGFGENIWIDQATSASVSSVLNVRTQHADSFLDTFMRGSARSVFVGVPGSGSLVKLYGFQNGNWVRGNVNSSGTFKFAVGDPGGFSSYWLAPYDNALCYLTRFAGDADDNNDKVTIYQNGQNWYLQQTGQTYGTARCMAYDQR